MTTRLRTPRTIDTAPLCRTHADLLTWYVAEGNTPPKCAEDILKALGRLPSPERKQTRRFDWEQRDRDSINPHRHNAEEIRQMRVDVAARRIPPGTITINALSRRLEIRDQMVTTIIKRGECPGVEIVQHTRNTRYITEADAAKFQAWFATAYEVCD